MSTMCLSCGQQFRNAEDAIAHNEEWLEAERKSQAVPLGPHGEFMVPQIQRHTVIIDSNQGPRAYIPTQPNIKPPAIAPPVAEDTPRPATFTPIPDKPLEIPLGATAPVTAGPSTLGEPAFCADCGELFDTIEQAAGHKTKWEHNVTVRAA
jgi:hypothetical protein